LISKISTTEENVEKLERHIDDLNKLLAHNNFAGTPYDDRAEAKASLKDLTAEKAALQNEKVELLKKENYLLLQQQQQSSAGTSMLSVR
jgi:CRISPR/Cas system-associated protein Cas10 (large subunit of type III CRISPR-Cas system)